MPELAFRKVQYGKEATRGTPVAATKKWTGTIKVPPDRKPAFVNMATGRRIKSIKGAINQVHVDGLTLAMDDGVFQMLPMIFSAGLKGGVTASEATPAQADYVWDFTPSLSAANSPNAFTIEFGDDVQAYEVEFCMCRRIKISGTIGDDASVKVESEWFGKQITPVAFTGALTTITPEIMAANMCKLYIDPDWASLGSTLKTDLVQEYSLEILTGVHPKFHAAGSKMMTGYGEGFIDAMLTLTLEGSAAADTEFDAFQAGTAKAIKLLIEGSQIGTGTNYSLAVGIYGQWESVIPLDKERNGNNLHTAIFHLLDDNLATPHALEVKVTTSSNAV